MKYIQLNYVDRIHLGSSGFVRVCSGLLLSRLGLMLQDYAALVGTFYHVHSNYLHLLDLPVVGWGLSKMYECNHINTLWSDSFRYFDHLDLQRCFATVLDHLGPTTMCILVIYIVLT